MPLTEKIYLQNLIKISTKDAGVIRLIGDLYEHTGKR